MSEGRKIWGVGPWIGVLTGAYFGCVVMVWWFFDPLPIQRLNPSTTYVAGGTIEVIGLVLYLMTWRRLVQAHRQKRLVTNGPYRYVRHPLYSIGIFVLTPGVCLLFRSWTVLTTPLFMYVVARWMVRIEESALEAEFGQAFRKRRAALIPFFRWG